MRRARSGSCSHGSGVRKHSCASGWQSRQQIVTMVNSGADDKNGGREPDRASEGALSAVLRCAALAAAATNANNRVIPHRGTGARQGERGGVVCGLTLRCACALGMVIPHQGA